MQLLLEPQLLSVEGRCGIDVVDDVANADSGHGGTFSPVRIPACDSSVTQVAPHVDITTPITT